MDQINKETASSLQVNHWKSFSAATKWFRNKENKPHYSFIVFDIRSFYPSILLSLFNKAIEFRKDTYNLSNDDISIISQSRKTLLFIDGKP